MTDSTGPTTGPSGAGRAAYPREQLQAQLHQVEVDLDEAFARCDAAWRQADAAAEARIDRIPHWRLAIDATDELVAVCRRGLATIELVDASVPAGFAMNPTGREWLDRHRGIYARAAGSLLARADRVRDLLPTS